MVWFSPNISSLPPSGWTNTDTAVVNHVATQAGRMLQIDLSEGRLASMDFRMGHFLDDCNRQMSTEEAKWLTMKSRSERTATIFEAACRQLALEVANDKKYYAVKEIITQLESRFIPFVDSRIIQTYILRAFDSQNLSC